MGDLRKAAKRSKFYSRTKFIDLLSMKSKKSGEEQKSEEWKSEE